LLPAIYYSEDFSLRQDVKSPEHFLQIAWISNENPIGLGMEKVLFLMIVTEKTEV
jgi:hypothetical protein